jgi:SAM-dependent methyltransferase
MASDSIQHLYETSADSVRASFVGERQRSRDYYAPLVDFVRRVAPPGVQRGRLLDVGCGSGWSTLAFAEAGYEATGIDLNPGAFEPPPAENVDLRQGNALAIAFPEVFDVVVMYQCIEHIPHPQQALLELERICKPEGVIVIVGPNLVTPFVPISYLLSPSTWKNLPLVRTSGLPRHPFGNALLEIIGITFLRGAQLLAKLMRRRPRFYMRDPDVIPPFYADNDAYYLCNPIDLISHFKCRGFHILRRGKHGRPPLSYLFAGGTWVAVRKPARIEIPESKAQS